MKNEELIDNFKSSLKIYSLRIIQNRNIKFYLFYIILIYFLL